MLRVLLALISPRVAGGLWLGNATSSAVRARSGAALDLVVSTTIPAVGSGCNWSSETAAAGQTLVARVGLPVASLVSRFPVIVTTAAPDAQRPSAGVWASCAHDAVIVNPGACPFWLASS